VVFVCLPGAMKLFLGAGQNVCRAFEFVWGVTLANCA